MSYTPPNGDTLVVSWVGAPAYSPPAGDALLVQWGADGISVDATLAATLPPLALPLTLAARDSSPGQPPLSAPVSIPCPYLPPPLATSVALAGCSWRARAWISATLPPLALPLTAAILGEHLGAPPTDVDATLVATLPTLTLPLTATLLALTDVDIPTDIGPSARLPSRHQLPHAVGVSLPAASQGLARANVARVRHGTGAPISRGTTLPHQTMTTLGRRAELPAAEALPRRRGVRLPVDRPARLARGVRLREQQALTRHTGTDLLHHDRIRLRNAVALTEAQGLARAERLTVGHHQAQPVGTRLYLGQQQMILPIPGWAGCYRVPRLRTILRGCGIYVPPDLALPIYARNCCRPIIIPIPPPPPPPPPGRLIVIPPARYYTVLHDISVRRLSDGLEIPASSVSIRIDADSWAWSWSATLLGRAALAACAPGPGGSPCILEVTISGYEWHLLVEDWTEGRLFGEISISVSGRGLSAELDAPYRAPVSGSTDEQTFVQLLDGLLPLDSGFVLDVPLDTPDWLVPAGAWSWANETPIGVMHAAAQAMGMHLVPARAARRLVLRERYATPPWLHASATPTLVIPASAIITSDGRPPGAARANAVWVHGGDTGGILARVLRAASAGDALAASTSHPLITDVIAARVVGTRILSGQAAQPRIGQVVLPLGGDFALGELGDLCHLDLDDGVVKGLVSGLAITAERSADQVRVRQTLNFGDDTRNPWSAWRELIPSDPRLLATVLANYEDGTAAVQLIGGGVIRVRGSATVGAAVWVKAGAIEGAAPSMPAFEIEV